MGDQVGQAVSGTLYYVPAQQFARMFALPLAHLEKTALFAAFCRINTLYMIARAGSGHIGSSFSSMDIMSWLQLNEIRWGRTGESAAQDIFFSSKGHDAPALYNTLIGLGKLDFDLIHQLRRLGGLPGHPDVATPHIVTNTGSLGMGVSKAKGMIYANRRRGEDCRVFVLTGDGELQEGQFWESLISAANLGLHELIVIVDHNKLQSDTLVAKVSDLGDLEGKFAAFGWHVSRCDGNDLRAFSQTLATCKLIVDKPKVIIADTIKGKGVSFMEHTAIDSDVDLYKFHSGAPQEEAYARAAQELIDAANALLKASGFGALELESVNRPVAVAPAAPQRLVGAYTNALLGLARANPDIVALDADLILDTGLIPFKQEFPERFVECGIAEQDMVSQAGGMALRGLLPIVHSFACFLSSRPNEQIYNNATEGSKIVYVASLAGLVPGGPGHSHQAVRDISSLAAVPGLVMIEPSCEAEVGMLFEWAVNTNSSSSYLRLVSVPWVTPYSLPDSYRAPELGKGVALTEGNDVAVIAYGPVMLSAACQAAALLKATRGLLVRVLNLPWLNHVDGEWLLAEVAGCKLVFSIDNHFSIGGQGDRIASVLAGAGADGLRLFRVGLDDIPVSGENTECLAWHGFSPDKLAERIGAACAGRP
ncbi:transketolase C-terminal domain-containing protein [Sphingorhabdus sp.]|uniref:transketolase C-terminal domain-containing protein n=1 Tax=Sphingorhabdus sp. TaxID=1902408 RepID=UPI0035B13F1A